MHDAPDKYVFMIAPDDGGYVATCPDVPEAVTGGATEQETRANIREALDIALCAYAAQGRPIPKGGTRAAGGNSYFMTRPSASAMVKIAFIEAFLASGMTRTAFAARLGKGETEVRRMLDPAHATKLVNLESGLAALGKRYAISVEELA